MSGNQPTPELRQVTLSREQITRLIHSGTGSRLIHSGTNFGEILWDIKRQWDAAEPLPCDAEAVSVVRQVLVDLLPTAWLNDEGNDSLAAAIVVALSNACPACNGTGLADG